MVFAAGRAAGAGMAQARSKRKRSKLGNKPTQAEVKSRIHIAYRDGVGNTKTAQVKRTISDENFRPSWDSVHRALGRKA
jgi:hypothetical protein